MIEPTFYIHADNATEDDFSQCRLVIEVNANSFSYVILNLRRMCPVVIKYYQFDQFKDRSLAEVLQETIYADDLLVTMTGETFLIYNFPESNLVPEKFFRMDANRELTELIYGNLNKGLILSEKIPWWELYNVYRIPADVHTLLQKKFTAGKYWHYYSLQLKSHKMFNAKEEKEWLGAIFYAEKMVVIAFKNGQLQLVQTFDYLDSKDVAYHLLNCCNQFILNHEEVILQVSGLIEKKSVLYNELTKYFHRLSFEEIEDSIKITDEFKEYPLHYFSSLLKMSVCV